MGKAMKAMKAMKKAMKAMKRKAAMKARGAMSQCCVHVSGRDNRHEDEGCEGCYGCTDGCGCGAGEEVRLLQACRHAQHEVEEQAGDQGTQGHQPLHQGALRFQGEACIQDRALPCPEEAQGDALRRVPAHVMERASFVL